MNIALILSGGIGRRLISEVPKQYVTVRGEMIITRTLKVICNNNLIDAVQVAADPGWREPILTEMMGVSKLKGFSMPGANRQLSILNGLKDILSYARPEDIVLIHDAVRPMVSDELISSVIKAVEGCDGAVPVLPMKDTVYISEDGKNLTGTLVRSKILAGQAPEAFLLGKYLTAVEDLSEEEVLAVSGSAEPALKAGLRISGIPGEEKNFKITTNEDLDRFIQIVENA